MKFTFTSFVYPIVAVNALIGSASAASCTRQDNLLYTYIVSADGVPDISGVCGGLWDNLKRFIACAPSGTSCGAVGEGNTLRWQFNAGVGCNGGMIESTWWEATRNNYGSIQCP